MKKWEQHEHHVTVCMSGCKSKEEGNNQESVQSRTTPMGT